MGIMNTIAPASTDCLRCREEHRRGNRRLTIGLFCFFALLVLGVATASYVAISRDRAEHMRFVRQCMQDHPEYWCTALWRAGRASTPDLLVLPMLIPSGK